MSTITHEDVAAAKKAARQFKSIIAVAEALENFGSIVDAIATNEKALAETRAELAEVQEEIVHSGDQLAEALADVQTAKEEAEMVSRDTKEMADNILREARAAGQKCIEEADEKLAEKEIEMQDMQERHEGVMRKYERDEAEARVRLDAVRVEIDALKARLN